MPDGYTERRAIDSPELEQSVLSLAPGAMAQRTTGAAEEVLYVLAGRGRIGEHAVAPETAVFVAPGESYAIECDEALELVSVRLPDPPPGDDSTRSAVVRLEEQDADQATADREFRVLAAPETGCRAATQFVGYLPPGRAPDHFHRYEEVLYVLAGEGLLHLATGDTPVASGASIHLPRRVVHSLENVGREPLQVLGVFRPAGSPAEAYYPDGRPAARS